MIPARQLHKFRLQVAPGVPELTAEWMMIRAFIDLQTTTHLARHTLDLLIPVKHDALE